MPLAGRPVSLERCSRRTSAEPCASAMRKRKRASERRARGSSCLLWAAFFKLGVTENGVLNDLIALILSMESGGSTFALGGANKRAELGMKQSGLGIDIEKRRSRPGQA